MKKEVGVNERSGRTLNPLTAHTDRPRKGVVEGTCQEFLQFICCVVVTGSLTVTGMLIMATIARVETPVPPLLPPMSPPSPLKEWQRHETV